MWNGTVSKQGDYFKMGYLNKKEKTKALYTPESQKMPGYLTKAEWATVAPVPLPFKHKKVSEFGKAHTGWITIDEAAHTKIHGPITLGGEVEYKTIRAKGKRAKLFQQFEPA